MKKTETAGIVFLAFLAGVAGAWVISPAQSKGGASAFAPARKESAYNRVMRTQTLRCGYVSWTPFLLKDPNNAQISGLFYDYTEALGKALHLKIEWAEEMGWGDFPAALNSGRIDALCSGSWPNSERAREIDFVRPILYQPTYAYARAGDTRFDNNLAAINDPAITAVFVEGSSQAVIVAHDFPKVKTSALPQLANLSDTLVNLDSGKADVAFVSTEAAAQYDMSNPGKIHRIEAKYPLRVFGNGLAVAGGEDRLQHMLNIATEEMLSSGQIETMVGHYPDYAKIWMPVGMPYQNAPFGH